MRLGTVGTIRPTLKPNDIPILSKVAAQTEVFNEAEINFISEIGAEILAEGPGSGYSTLIAQNEDRILGFTIFGPIPGTDHRYELYWIATDPAAQRSGVAKALMRDTMAQAKADGATHLFIDTSTRPGYSPAHALYRSCGFEQVALIPDYFAEGDGKITFGRRL
jgi:ribosomal protein S18 acetylase RimI-like enzyme